MITGNKYQLLINTLDAIISEAPERLSSSKYDTSDDDKINQARSRALIQLYLRTRFGLVNFTDAENYITDGAGDGGLDAYYIDREDKSVYLVQSKFRTKEENFETRDVDGYDLFKMDLGPITNGDEVGSSGARFNGKILQYQREIREITDISRYEFILVFLGNVPQELDPFKLISVSGGVCSKAIVVNGKDTYNELLLPYLQSNFYNKKDFSLKIKLSKNQSNRISHLVLTNGQNVNINLSFIPTYEIAKMMWEYKNSLLLYNPRCYVGIKRGGVNEDILGSIVDTDSNEFSLLNNGITMVCSNFKYTENNAEPDTATILVTNPQIVNGGQTAYTLAKLYSEGTSEIFNNKEVLVKFISIIKDSKSTEIKLIEKISKATNSQTPVNLSDRKSNDQQLIRLQQYLFENHGMLLERKKGEFYEALDNKIIPKDIIVTSELLMRLIIAMRGSVSEARSNSNDKLFRAYPVQELRDRDFMDVYDIIKIHTVVVALQGKGNEKSKYRIKEFGFGLNYGKYAIVAAAHWRFKVGKINDHAEAVSLVVKKWGDFERTVSKKQKNIDYFDDSFNFDNYYKGKTINSDLKDYFGFKK